MAQSSYFTSIADGYNENFDDFILNEVNLENIFLTMIY